MIGVMKLAVYMMCCAELAQSFQPHVPFKVLGPSTIASKYISSKIFYSPASSLLMSVVDEADNLEADNLDFYLQDTPVHNKHHSDTKASNFDVQKYILPLGFLLGAIFTLGSGTFAIDLGLSPAQVTANLFDPAQFQPVCPASDGVYQVMKSIAGSLIGSENAIQYGPLIAGVLLRVRLELCVFESFLYEAVIPFIKQNGVSWILPLKETGESVVAGTIFAVASNFILLGSGTKIFAVLMIYYTLYTITL
jgi:hypothetical protein